jgi:hypothetical protein
VLPWWPKEATLNLASEETPTLAGSSRCRWRNHLVMSGDIISLRVAASVGISTLSASEDISANESPICDSGPRRLPAAEIESAIERVTLRASRVEIALADAADVEEQDRRLVLPWTRSSPHRRRDIIQGTDESGRRPRQAMRARAREVFIAALSRAHRWLDELLSDAETSIATVAARERKSERSIRMTLSLVFLAPDLVRAAIEGRLPRGFNRTRLVHLPMLWFEQWHVLGLEPPAM